MRTVKQMIYYPVYLCEKAKLKASLYLGWAYIIIVFVWYKANLGTETWKEIITLEAPGPEKEER